MGLCLVPFPLALRGTYFKKRNHQSCLMVDSKWKLYTDTEIIFEKERMKEGGTEEARRERGKEKEMEGGEEAVTVRSV